MKNYHLRQSENIALRAMENRKGLKTLLLEGSPGTGKTFFAECLAEHWDASYLYYLCHHWTGDEEMFLSVNVGRIAAGVDKPDDAYEFGVLTKTAIASQSGKVVLCLDEIDKAPQRAESLLLDFLQHGRVYLPDGQKIQGNLKNMAVIITSNAVRPLMEATLRRCYRMKMEFLPPNVESDIIRKATGAKMGVIRVVVRMMTIIRTNGVTAPSLQEGRMLVEDLKVATCSDDVTFLIKGWLVKEPEDWEALVKEFGSQPQAVLWGEFKR